MCDKIVVCSMPYIPYGVNSSNSISFLSAIHSFARGLHVIQGCSSLLLIIGSTFDVLTIPGWA